MSESNINWRVDNPQPEVHIIGNVYPTPEMLQHSQIDGGKMATDFHIRLQSLMLEYGITRVDVWFNGPALFKKIQEK